MIEITEPKKRFLDLKSWMKEVNVKEKARFDFRSQFATETL